MCGKVLKMVCLMALGVLTFAACEKPIEENANSIVGTWTDDRGSYMSIIFYDMDGNFIDSIPWELTGKTFTFREDGTVTAPWNYDYDYVLSGDTVLLRHEGWKDRVYRILSLSEDHLVMEYPNATDYTMGDSTPVVGIELEHWSLRRQ